MNYSTQNRGLDARVMAATPDTLQSAIEEFAPEIGRLEKLVAGLSSMADKISGSRPSDAIGGATEPARDSLIDNVQGKRRQLSHLLSAAESELSRIGVGLGG